MASIRPDRPGEQIVGDLDKPGAWYCDHTDLGCWYDH